VTGADTTYLLVENPPAPVTIFAGDGEARRQVMERRYVVHIGDEIAGDTYEGPRIIAEIYEGEVQFDPAG
jgi:hypothetical protein